ncbi:MAG: glycosyltransferase family 2 protein [Candidatus Methanomethylicia archaeon]
MSYEKVCAVIVTFNRKETLLKCLSALLNQTYPLTSIFVIDGPSIDGTEKALAEYNFIKEIPPSNEIKVWHTENIIVQGNKRIKFHFVRIYNDIGGSGGFYEGFKRAYNEGCDWIWVMDDDVLPESTTLWRLITALKTGYDAARPALIDCEDFSPWFAGGIFSRNAIKKVGLPLKEFFIYWDDVEYAARCKRNGIKMLDVMDAKVHHKGWIHRGINSKIVLGRIVARPVFPRGRKYYYIQRNKFYFYLRHRKFKALICDLSIGLIRDLIAYLVLRDVDKVLSIIKGTLDVFFRKTGRCEWAHTC